MEVYEAIKHDVSILIGLIFLAYLILGVFNIGVDSTDKNGFNRSDLKLHTDYGTGLQYLSTKGGALIPRLDANGKHMRLTGRSTSL